MLSRAYDKRFSYMVYCFIFKKNHGFIEEGNPSEKVTIVEEELDGIDRDDIVNQNINGKKKLDVSQ